MIVLAVIVAVATLAAGAVAAVGVRYLPSVRLQLVGLSLVCVALPLAAVALSGAVMFSTAHDLTVLVVAAAASTVAVAAGIFIAGALSDRLDGVRDAAASVAGGNLSARAPEDGPAELAEVARSFNTMAEDVEGLFDARRQLVAWASHDLRTPLASIQAMIEALEDGLAEPERYLPAMRRQVGTLSTLVDDLFELARIDAGALTLELRDARLNAVVQACIEGMEAEAEARHVKLASNITDPLPPVRCAPDSLERVIYNLLTNALRHTPSDGSVAVLVEARDREVEIAVEDTGKGIPSDALERVFDRFWRDDAARSPARAGSGLGLAIARGLVEAQGGRIWAENRPDGGARFAFTLPTA